MTKNPTQGGSKFNRWKGVNIQAVLTGSTLGGFHIFASREAAYGYLGSDLAAGLIANEAFSEFQIRHFDVLDEFSAITGSPEKLLTEI